MRVAAKVLTDNDMMANKSILSRLLAIAEQFAQTQSGMTARIKAVLLAPHVGRLETAGTQLSRTDFGRTGQAKFSRAGGYTAAMRPVRHPDPQPHAKPPTEDRILLSWKKKQ